MVRRVLPLWLAACASQPPLPQGSWLGTLTCADEAVPACERFTAVIGLDDDAPPRGEHLTLFPGHARADGGYSGMAGPLTGAWEAGLLTLDLLPDLGGPLISADDAVAWEGHVLRVEGRPQSTCWSASWSFLDADGTPTWTGDGSICEAPGGR